MVITLSLEDHTVIYKILLWRVLQSINVLYLWLNTLLPMRFWSLILNFLNQYNLVFRFNFKLFQKLFKGVSVDKHTVSRKLFYIPPYSLLNGMEGSKMTTLVLQFIVLVPPSSMTFASWKLPSFLCLCSYYSEWPE